MGPGVCGAAKIEGDVGMKIKDLPEGTDLRGVRFRVPGNKKKYYWYSQWQKGIWTKKDMKDKKVAPLFLDSLKDALEFEVIGGD